MADVKISALPASTTPLAGTEVLPIVQSSTTKQVSVANLTAGRAVSALSLTSTTTLGVTGTSTLSGNAIISVTDNTNAALRITQLGTGNALLVEDSTNPDASPFVVSASGQVIVGNTTSISGYNDNVGTGRVPQIQLQGSSLDTASQTLTSWHANGVLSPYLFLAKSQSGAIGTRGVVGNGALLGSASFSGDDGTAFIQAASISASVDGTPGTNDMPGRLVFSTTADGAATPTERMRINSSGVISYTGSLTVAAYVETVVPITLTSAGAVGTLVITAGTVLTATLTASTPCTFAMPTSPVAGQSFILRLTQAATGMTTATFTGVKWPGGTVPTITATASAVDILSFVYIGTSWYGNAAQAFA
jgi:hypothetical protein